ncbi:hypothetical protein [Rhizobium leguminosarum]|uniref:hypothetical protein n=1 Tax=Rhizobium TaxID=379 RepID=UPI00140FD9D1|nr:hypothetical protein [Rhizobium leguminosarum]QIO65650.1 hypothetical protein HA462_11530 [Rhizobium leguminosarum bv. trifolii]
MMNAISLALTKPMGEALAIPPPWVPDASRYMPAATGTRWPAGFTQTYAADLNYQCSKLFFGSPDYETNDFLIPFVGFGCTEGNLAPQETILPNADIAMDEVFFIHPNGTEYPVLFGGNAAATVTASTGIVYGQVTLPSALPAWSVFGIRTVWHGTVGQTYIGGYRCQRHRGEKYWAAADLASIRALALANGASTPARDTFYNTVGNESNSQPLAYGPAMVLAKGWDGRPVPMVLSDSLIERQEIAATADARRNMGMWLRWLDVRDPVWGSIIPLVMGVPGSKSVQELATSATKRWAMIDAIRDTYNGGKNIWTFVLDQSGRNDNSATASTWSNAKLGLVDRVKTRYGAGIHVVGVTIIPTMTASSDSGRSVAGYTVPALWTTTLATVNNTIKASSRYAKVIDQLLAFTADTDPTKSPAAEMFPLGNVVGHPGNQDGVTTWDTIKLPASVPNGTRIMFEYQPGLWTSRTTYDRVDNGDGTADYKVIEVFATNVQDNAALLAHGMNLDVSSYVHPVLQGILRFVSRLPQSEKLKFYT